MGVYAVLLCVRILGLPVERELSRYPSHPADEGGAAVLERALRERTACSADPFQAGRQGKWRSSKGGGGGWGVLSKSFQVDFVKICSLTAQKLWVGAEVGGGADQDPRGAPSPSLVVVQLWPWRQLHSGEKARTLALLVAALTSPGCVQGPGTVWTQPQRSALINRYGKREKVLCPQRVQSSLDE